MLPVLQLKCLFIACVLGAAICSAPGLGPASAQSNSPVGCWRYETKEGCYTNFLEICLGEGGKAEVTEFRNGNGLGRNAKWEVVDNGKLSLTFPSGAKAICQFSLTDPSKLALNECSSNSYLGVYTAENVSGRSARPSVCWAREYPGNGNFEVAKIARRTPAITELEHKQVKQKQSQAEAGTIVVVWSRSGRYACVESPTGIPDSYFWVDQRDLKDVPSAPRGKDPWRGVYTGNTTVEIIPTSDGRYDVYGENPHTMGEGPGWGFTTKNEIFAYSVKRQANAIQVTLRRDVTTAGSKAPKNVPSPGFIDDRCKPVLFVQGPVLLIKDTGDCGDGSAFQGYYLRNI